MSEESPMDVRRMSDNGGVTDGTTDATALQSARELRSDGGCEAMAMML